MIPALNYHARRDLGLRTGPLMAGEGVMWTKTLSVAAACGALLISADVVLAQPVPRPVNPGALEFSLSGLASADGYRVEVFPSSADTRTASAIKVIEIPHARLAADVIQVDVAAAMADVDDGEYIATIRTADASLSERSAPSHPFVLARGQSVEERQAEARRDRFWTKVAIAIGGSILVIPLLF